jgi:hypothetical protein
MRSWCKKARNRTSKGALEARPIHKEKSMRKTILMAAAFVLVSSAVCGSINQRAFDYRTCGPER